MTIVMIVLAVYAAAWCVLALTGSHVSGVALATPLRAQDFGSESEPVRAAA